MYSIENFKLKYVSICYRLKSSDEYSMIELPDFEAANAFIASNSSEWICYLVRPIFGDIFSDLR